MTNPGIVSQVKDIAIISGIIAIGVWVGTINNKVELVLSHISGPPHAGVQTMFAVLNTEVKGIHKDMEQILSKFDDRYRGADAARDWKYFCGLNPEIKCPAIYE